MNLEHPIFPVVLICTHERVYNTNLTAEVVHGKDGTYRDQSYDRKSFENNSQYVKPRNILVTTQVIHLL